MTSTTNVRIEFRKLLAGVESLDEMKELNAIFNARWREIQTERSRAAVSQLDLKPGARVEFTAKGREIHGTVEKVNKKSVSVQEDRGVPLGGGFGTLGLKWKVSPHLLRAEKNRPVVQEQTLKQAPLSEIMPARPSDDEIDLIISPSSPGVCLSGGAPEKIKTLRRRDFKASEWKELLARVRESSIGAKGATRHRLQGGECLKEIAGTNMGGCGEHQVVTISVRRPGPEVAVFRNRCLSCGKEEEDVAD